MSTTTELGHAAFYTGETASPEITGNSVIPPAEGAERNQLLLANETLLASPNFTPENLSTLMSNMVRLLGAQESESAKGQMQTPYLIDAENDKALQFWGFGLEKGQRPHLLINPGWEALPGDEGKAAYDALTEPYMTENVRFTYYDVDRDMTYPLGSAEGRNVLTVEVSHRLNYPPGYIAPEYISYATGEDAKQRNWRNTTSPLARETHLSAPKPLGQRLWNAFIDANIPPVEVENATQGVLIDTSTY